AYNAVMATKSADSSFLDDAKLRTKAANAGSAAGAPHEAQARHLETEGKLACASLKKSIDEQCKKIEDDGIKAKDAVNTATQGQVKAIETKISDLAKIADGRIKKAEDDLKTKLSEGETKLKDSLKGSE